MIRGRPVGTRVLQNPKPCGVEMIRKMQQDKPEELGPDSGPHVESDKIAIALHFNAHFGE
jgi:hypothetical protein